MIFGPCQETSYTAIHWCIQNYSYEFGFQARTTHRWLLENSWVKRFVWFLDRFHSIYSIGRETSRRKYVVRREINEKTADIQAWSSMARTLVENGKGCWAEGEAKVVTWKTSTWYRSKIAKNLFHRPWGQGIQGDHQECSQEIGNISGSRYALQDQQEQSELWEWW